MDIQLRVPSHFTAFHALPVLFRAGNVHARVLFVHSIGTLVGDEALSVGMCYVFAFHGHEFNMNTKETD